jgi:hypothetical protein
MERSHRSYVEPACTSWRSEIAKLPGQVIPTSRGLRASDCFCHVPSSTVSIRWNRGKEDAGSSIP